MSVVGPPDAVYESNRKLFARYMSIFRNRNPKEFVQYATRFAKWLGDSKAYYPEARQEIISLLLIAQANLRRTLGLHDEFSRPFHVDHFPNNEMVAAYAAMVRAVEPFSVYFVEPSLSAHLFKLRETVAHSASSSSAASMSSDYTVSANPLPLIPQPSHQYNGSRNLLNHTTTSMVSTPQTPTASTSSTLPSNGAPLPLAAQVQHHPPPHPVGAPPPQSSHSIPPNATVPSKPPQKKIVKKRKTLDYQELYSQDIQSFLQKKKANQPTPPLFLPSDASSATPEPAQRASPQVVVPNMGTSRPTSVAADAPQVAIRSSGPPTHSSNVLKHPSPRHVETSSEDMVVDREQQTQRNDGRANPDPVDTPTAIPQPTNPPQQKSSDADNSKTQDDAMEVDSQNHIAPPSEQVLHLDSRVSIDHTASLHGFNMQVDQCDPLLGQVQADTHDAIGKSPVRVAPCPHVDQVLARRFSDHADYNTPFEFVVPRDIYNDISRWKDCVNPAIDLKATACITLECFSSDGIDATLTDNELLAKLNARSSSWPDTGSLYLLLGSNDTAETIPLSPPLAVTPDNSVDLSEFVVSGINTAQLLSTRKLPGILFVIHAHSPTTKQQEEAEETRKQERDWQSFLTDLTRPFIHPSI